MRAVQRYVFLSVILALSGCAAVPRASAPPTPPPAKVAPLAPPPVTVQSQRWEDWKATPGTWVYEQQGGVSLARYGRAGADLARITCHREAGQKADGRLFVARSVVGGVSSEAQLTMRASDAARAYRATVSPDAPSWITAIVAASDPQLDALAFSRGKVVLSVPGSPDLVLPSWAEIGRIVEDCRG